MVANAISASTHAQRVGRLQDKAELRTGRWQHSIIEHAGVLSAFLSPGLRMENKKARPLPVLSPEACGGRQTLLPAMGNPWILFPVRFGAPQVSSNLLI